MTRTSIEVGNLVKLNFVLAKNIYFQESLKSSNQDTFYFSYSKHFKEIHKSSKTFLTKIHANPRPRTTGSGRKSRPKNFKTPFFSRYHKSLPWSNSNMSKTSQNFFQNFFSTNMVARGAQSFCLLEGTTDTQIQ